jgi:hypothetical protein
VLNNNNNNNNNNNMALTGTKAATEFPILRRL